MYQSIDKEKSKTKGLALGAAAASLLFGSAYFLYSGAYGVETPLHSFFANEEQQAQSIRIEYNMDDMPLGIKPNTPEWTAYHDMLMNTAGYDAKALRANPNAEVSFIAHDSREGEEEEEEVFLHPNFENQPMRKSFGITCYNMYTEVGTTNVQSCEPNTSKDVTKPIRTGCSSLGSGTDITGSVPFGPLGCKAKSANERVTARCCQPTPNTRYKRSSFKVSIATNQEMDDKCTSVTCPNADDQLVGCSGSTSATGWGGAQADGDGVCRTQSQQGGINGFVTANAMCAAQPTKGNYNLRCRQYNSGGSIATSDGFSSSIQCPKGNVMFDCTAFIQRRMEECDGTKSFLLHEEGNMDTSNDVLNGEYYFKETKASKAFCEGVGDSDKVRVQAICCQFLKNKGPSE